MQHALVSSPLDTRFEPSLNAMRADGDAMRRVAQLGQHVAASRSHAWISGEAGSGKQWLARAIAANGREAERPFSCIDCREITENALDETLARMTRGGTLYLKNVEALSGLLQAELLQALQSGESRPAGVEPARTQGIQILAGSRRPAVDAIAGTGFREELFWRLHEVHIDIPPLRERLGDIPGLASDLAAKHGGHPQTALTPMALATLRSHDWPENIREFEGLVQRSLETNRSHTIDVDDFTLLDAHTSQQGISDDGVMLAMRALASLGVRLDRIELAYVRATLDHLDGNKTRAAATLGIDRKTLYRKLANEEVMRAAR